MPFELEFGLGGKPPRATLVGGIAYMSSAVALAVAAGFVEMSVPRWAVWVFSAALFAQGVRDVVRSRRKRG
jgi:hypothetical protein